MTRGKRQPEPENTKLEVVRFRTLLNYKEDAFCLELSNTLTCRVVAERVASHLGLGNSFHLGLKRIIFTSHNCDAQQPRSKPNLSWDDPLSDMLGRNSMRSNILYYKVLSSKSQGKFLNIAFHHATKAELLIRSVAIYSTVGELLCDLKKKVELSHRNAELRLLQIVNNRIHKIYPPSARCSSINGQYWTLRAEEIQEEEKKLGSRGRLIHVCHFKKDEQMGVQNFEEPFFFIIHEGETLAEIKLRIQKKLHVPDREFSKWKFAFVWYTPVYLQDSDVVFSRFPESRDVYGGDWEKYLGMEHSDSAYKRAYAANREEEEEMLVSPLDHVEGQQPMEVAQAEIVSATGSQPVEDPLFTRFTWKIENFSRLKTKKHYSDVFLVGYYKWQVMIYPKGNNVDHLSVYLTTVDSANLLYAEFSLAVVNQIHNKYTVTEEAEHQFTAIESDWGFPSFMHLRELKDPARGFIMNDTCIIEAEVSICRPLKKQKVAVPMYSSDNSEKSSALSGKSMEAESQSHALLGKAKEAESQIGPPSGESMEAESQAGTPLEVEVPIEEMDPISSSGPELEVQTKLDGKISEVEVPIEEMDQISALVPDLEMQAKLDGKGGVPAVMVEEGSTKVQLTEQLPKPATPNEVMVPEPSTQSSGIVPPLEYPGAGQLFEEGRHRQDVLDVKFEDIGGFSILRTHASLYKKIWLKYGHIASSQVLTVSYSGQVALVSDIMCSITDMHHRCLSEVSPEMIELWEKNIKMAEILKFNIRWLRERFEDVKKDSFWEKELTTTKILEKDQSIQAAQARLNALEAEMKKVRDNLSTLQTEKQMYLEKGSRLLFDGLF